MLVVFFCQYSSLYADFDLKKKIQINWKYKRNATKKWDPIVIYGVGTVHHMQLQI